MDTETNVYSDMNLPFFIGQQKQESPFNMPMYHYHYVYEIYYLLEGRRNYFIQNRTYPVTAGDIVLINIQDIHKTMEMNNTPHERVLVHFEKAFLTSMIEQEHDVHLLDCFLSERKVLHLKVSEQAFVQSILLKMVDEYKKKKKGYLLYEKILLTELLLFINRYLEQSGHEGISYNSQLHKKMSEVALFLMENYMHKISLQHVADHFFVTPCHLSRAFKKTTGFTFIEYLNSIRIKEAQKLLKETRKSVMQIAELTGFDSQTHFGRVFKGIKGISPLQYRKQPGM